MRIEINTMNEKNNDKKKLGNIYGISISLIFIIVVISLLLKPSSTSITGFQTANDKPPICNSYFGDTVCDDSPEDCGSYYIAGGPPSGSLDVCDECQTTKEDKVGFDKCVKNQPKSSAQLPLLTTGDIGDINKDGCVDILDLVYVASAYNTEKGQNGYTLYGDYNKDGKVNILDLIPVITNLNKGDCEFKADSQPSDFKPSKALYDISEETKKPDQYYCEYDTTRNKVVIIIKKDGVYDDKSLINKFNEYFIAVKKHLNIENVGVQKFSGSTIKELDQFIENLVKKQYVGYIIFVGEDLPIVDKNENTGGFMLDFPAINDIYSYVGRKRQVSVNECVDLAISYVFPPLIYPNENKRLFIKEIFSNFIKYHNNPEEIFNDFKDILIIGWDDNIGAPLGDQLNPSKFSEYRKIYFYPVTYVLNSDFEKVHSEMKKKHLIFGYNVHGLPNLLGIELSGESKENLQNKITSTNQEVLDFYNQNGQFSLFIGIKGACGQEFLSEFGIENCCWPQTWLKTGNWAAYSVNGYPYHHNFHRWLFKEKVIGKALRKTYHLQHTIYGDILGTLP